MVSPLRRKAQDLAPRPSGLQMVSAHELRSLHEALGRGQLPADLEAKLRGLAKGGLAHQFIEQHCRTIAALLLAVRDGSFNEAGRAECERLLRLLAYVRKDDDAIPDYRPDGFLDNQQEVRAVITDLDALLRSFKAWRLRYQVPQLWAEGARGTRLGVTSQHLTFVAG